MNHEPPNPSLPRSTHPPGVFGTALESARQTGLLLVRNRLVWIVVVAEVLFAAAAFVSAGLANERMDGSELFCVFAWWLLAGLVLPWSTLYLAVQAIHTEVEDRTFQYLFLRPVGRSGLLLGKWIAVAAISAAVAGFGGLVLFAAVAARRDCWANGVDLDLGRAVCGMLAGGAVAYAAVGAWFAATFRRPLLVASVAVVLQALVVVLPVSAGIRMLTVADPLRRFLVDRIEPTSKLTRLLWPTEPDLRLDLVGRPLVSLLVYSAVALALALFRYCRSEYDSRERE